MNTPHADPSGPPGGGYEKSDLTLPLVATFGGILALVLVAVLVLIVWMLDFFGARHPRLPAPAATVTPLARSGPREPRLQVDAFRDLKSMRTAEEALLGSYGWVDRQGGTVRIPLARAMELLAERGLPAPPAPSAPAASRRRR
jgi:hypothetical protein